MKSSKKRKMPLSLKLAVAMSLIVFGTVLVMWFVNNTFLERYYLDNKQKTMLSAYSTIAVADESEDLYNDDFDVVLEGISRNNNLDILVISGMQIVKSSFKNSEEIWEQIFQLSNDMSSPNAEVILDGNGSYLLEKLTDKKSKVEYLVFVGVLKNSDMVYIRTSIQSIEETARVTNYFLTVVGSLSLLISIIIIIFLARGITRPIKKLSDISERMKALDFQAKYDGQGGSREIDSLGQHMNEMSYTLEKTISELKTANNELKQDIEKKEQVDEMRKEFLSNVSHELKTPIALIQGYAEGLVEGISDDPESRNFYCEVIMDEANKMNTMVKKLISLNQLEFGTDNIEMERFDLLELVKGVVNASSIMLEQKKISLELEISDPLYVWGDVFKVEEVITNYLSNAINHVKEPKQIRIFASQQEGHTRLSVFNTGEQIPEDELDKIWIKFYKVDKARTREYGGSGIGLSIVKAIMESLNQKCGVKNHENGVEFWLELDN